MRDLLSGTDRLTFLCRLHVPAGQVKLVYLAACQLKMDKVVKVCSQYLIQHLSVKNCIEIRSLPGINKNKSLVAKVDRYINKQVTNNILADLFTVIEALTLQLLPSQPDLFPTCIRYY